MSALAGPGTPFAVLFDRGGGAGVSLPASFRAVYGGDWRLPQAGDRPYVFVNFAVSHDGRISFNLPGHTGAADITQRNRHDRWLMGLLRARADAVMVGETTFRLSPTHLWTAEAIFPKDAAAFAALRRAEGRPRMPLCVVLSERGDLPADPAVVRRGLPVLVATTSRGLGSARALARRGQVEVVRLGAERVDVRRLLALLRQRHGVRTLLCEGGARTYGSLLDADCVDEEFLTICPLLVGSGTADRQRPCLVEGVGFAPGGAPRLVLISVRQAGNYLFLRARVRHGPRRPRRGRPPMRRTGGP